MENENESQALPGASGEDQAQEDAKLIPVDEAEILFETAGVPRNQRTIRRYCDNKMLDCFKVNTTHGLRWMIDRVSADKYIVQLQQTQEVSNRTSPGAPGTVRRVPVTSGDDHLTKMMEKVGLSNKDTIEFLKSEIAVKNDQLARKDEHIDQLTETILGINQTAALVGRLAGTLLPKPTEKTSPDTSGGAQESSYIDVEQHEEGGDNHGS